MKLEGADVFVGQRHHMAYHPLIKVQPSGLRLQSRTAKWDDWNQAIKETDTDMHIDLKLDLPSLAKEVFRNLEPADQARLLHQLLDITIAGQ